MQAADRRHGQYIWRDPESDDQLRVDVFGSEEFFEDLLALGFVPNGPARAPSEGSGEPADPEGGSVLADGPRPARETDSAAVEAPIHRLPLDGATSQPRGTSEGRREVRRKGA